MTQDVKSETAFMASIVDRYRRQGFTVEVAPPASSLPTFLRPYRPDLIARNDTENVVVEIKRRGGTPSVEHLKSLSEAIAREKAWRLDIVLYEAETRPESLPPIQLVEATLKDSERLFQSGQRAAALLLAWSALEGAAKVHLQTSGTETSRVMASFDLLKTLVSVGALEEDDYRVLIEVGNLRNRIAHGSLSYDVSKDDILHVTGVARRLLNLGRDAAA